jgi:hypothetical protein
VVELKAAAHAPAASTSGKCPHNIVFPSVARSSLTWSLCCVSAVWLLCAAGGSSGGGGGVARSAAVGFDGLLLRSGISHPDPHVLVRCHMRFGRQVEAAVASVDPVLAVQLAYEVYTEALSFPSTTTVETIAKHGYILTDIVVGKGVYKCYKGFRVYAAKRLSVPEKERTLAFKAAVEELGPALGQPEYWIPHLATIEFLPAPHDTYLLMPLYAHVFQVVYLVEQDDIMKLWTQLRTCVQALHDLGYAHMDIKPDNMCSDIDGNLVLIDVGSVAKFGAKTFSTRAYVPRDRYASEMTSAAVVDWWMVATTLAERACGEERLEMGMGAKFYSSEQIEDHLEQHLLPAVWAQLRDLLHV